MGRPISSTHASKATSAAPAPIIEAKSAIDLKIDSVDLICTDPPYYDAIPYSDLMDFFHIWLRRILLGLSPETDAVFADTLGPKWNRDKQRRRIDRSTPAVSIRRLGTASKAEL